MAAQKVWLQPRPKLTKIRYLWPFLPRYRRQRGLLDAPSELVPLVGLVRVSRDGRIVLVKNPKCATSTMEARIKQWRGGSGMDGVEGEDWVMPASRKSLADVVAALNDKSAKIVSFVRDPYRRTASAFSNFLVDRKNRNFPRHVPYLTRMGYRPDGDIGRNFDVFLDYLAACFEADAAYTDAHFRQQVLNLRMDVIDYAFIGRVETLAEDLAKMEAVLGVQGLEPPQSIEARNVSRGRYDPTPAQRRKIRELYAPDFEAFGYAD